MEKLVAKASSGRKKWDTKEVRVEMANFWKGSVRKHFRLCELVFG